MTSFERYACVHVGACVYVRARACVYALKIVSMDKILRFTTCITIKSLIKHKVYFV